MKQTPHYITDLARTHRRDMTDAEAALWKRIRRKRLNGLRFRRQHPVGRYIADFYCHELKLLIELDGAPHDNRKEYDEHRDAYLEGGGITVLRFSNDQIEHSMDTVLETICVKATELK
jgi:very-short-patch-repair endonuclease